MLFTPRNDVTEVGKRAFVALTRAGGGSASAPSPASPWHRAICLPVTILDAARSWVRRAPSSSPRPRFRRRRWRRLTHRPFGPRRLRRACLRAARQSPVAAADRMHCKINVGPAHYSSSSVTCHFHRAHCQWHAVLSVIRSNFSFSVPVLCSVMLLPSDRQRLTHRGT